MELLCKGRERSEGLQEEKAGLLQIIAAECPLGYHAVLALFILLLADARHVPQSASHHFWILSDQRARKRFAKAAWCSQV